MKKAKLACKEMLENQWPRSHNEGNHFSEYVSYVKLASNTHICPGECKREILSFYLTLPVCTILKIFTE